MGKIYLIRHGQTDANSERKFQGRIDTALNAAGIEQAHRLAAYMAQLPLDAIYCSTMLRAKMTAQPLAEARGVPVYYLEKLQESSFGLWEGLTYTEIRRHWQQEIDLFLARPGDCVPPQGETFAEVQQRAGEALFDILRREGNDANIALISHGGVLRTLIGLLLDIPLNNLWRINIHNASVSIFSNWDGNFTAETINCHHYL